jgi:hypothetical protein
MAGYPGLGPPLACPGQLLAFPEEHDAITEKQDEVAWNATTGTLTVSWKRWCD